MNQTWPRFIASKQTEKGNFRGFVAKWRSIWNRVTNPKSASSQCRIHCRQVSQNAAALISPKIERLIPRLHAVASHLSAPLEHRSSTSSAAAISLRSVALVCITYSGKARECRVLSMA